MPIEVSLVICSYNRANLLARGLEAASEQDLPPSDFEVVVVDDRSTDHTADVVRSMMNRFQPGHLIHLHAPESGTQYRSPTRARNVGLRAARGRLVAFTDPECVYGPRMLISHVEFHREAASDSVVTTAPWQISEGLTRRLDRAAWSECFRALLNGRDTADVRRSKIEGPWFDAHFTSVKKAWAFLNGGFNERFESWGYESSDFARRLNWHGLIHVQDLSPEAEVYHLWHESPKGYGNRRMAIIEESLNGPDRASLMSALKLHGEDLTGFDTRTAYGKARLRLLRMTVSELNVFRETLDQECARLLYPRIRRYRARPPGDPIYGLEPWIGFRHLADWDEHETVIGWLQRAEEESPDIKGILVEKVKAYLKLGKMDETRAALERLGKIDSDHPLIEALLGGSDRTPRSLQPSDALHPVSL